MLRPSGQTQVFDPMAAALIQQSQSQAPMQNWLQPLGRLAQFGVGHYREQKGKREANELLQKAFADPNANPQQVAAMLMKNPRTAQIGTNIYGAGLQARMKAKVEEATFDKKIEQEIRKAKALLPFQMARARAGATRVNVAMGPREKEFDKAMGKADADAVKGANKAAESAIDTINKLRVLGKLQDRFESGPGTQTQADIASFLQKMGMSPQALGLTKEQLADVQSFRAVSQQLVMQQMETLKGSVSDKEWVMLQQQVPNLMNSPGGNKRVIEIMTKMAQRQAMKSRAMLEYRRKNGSLDGFTERWRQYNEKNPILPEAQTQTPNTPQTPNASPPPPKGYEVR